MPQVDCLLLYQYNSMFFCSHSVSFDISDGTYRGQVIPLKSEFRCHFKQTPNAKMSTCREALQRLEGTIQADREQLVSLEAAINSKQKAIADNEEMLELYTNQIADVQAQLGTKELGKLTAAEVKESHQLKDDLLQWQVIAELPEAKISVLLL